MSNSKTPGRTLAGGKYELIDVIGNGGMAVVYRARHTGTERILAIKMLLPAMAKWPKVQARFALEARAMGKLKHRHIVDIHDVELNGTAFIVMELVTGGSLLERVYHHGPLNHREAVRICLQVLEALTFAHEHGVIHRDVKPQNILFDERGEVKITDFGIARVKSDNAGFTKAAPMGTPAFMSPEQEEDPAKVDARTDVYSVGVTLFSMLTGITGELEGECDIFDELPTLARKPEVLERIPELFRDIVVKATVRSLKARYQSAAEMAEALRMVCEQLPEPSDEVAPEPEPQIEDEPAEVAEIEESPKLNPDEAEEPQPEGSRASMTLVAPEELAAEAGGPPPIAVERSIRPSGMTELPFDRPRKRRRLLLPAVFVVLLLFGAAAAAVVLVGRFALNDHSDEQVVTQVEQPDPVSVEIEVEQPEPVADMVDPDAGQEFVEEVVTEELQGNTVEADPIESVEVPEPEQVEPEPHAVQAVTPDLPVVERVVTPQPESESPAVTTEVRTKVEAAPEPEIEEPAEPSLVHTPVSTIKAGKDVTVMATVNPADYRLTVYFRPSGQGAYTSLPMRKRGNEFSANISWDESFATAGGMDYRIAAEPMSDELPRLSSGSGMQPNKASVQ